MSEKNQNKQDSYKQFVEQGIIKARNREYDLAIELFLKARKIASTASST